MKNLYKAAYSYFCFLYALSISILEEIFFKKPINKKEPLEKLGYLKIDKSNKLNISTKKFDFVLSQNKSNSFGNKYQKIIPLSKDDLNYVIGMIFDTQFCDFLTSQTGFKYNIDFFSAYQNFSIPISLRDKAWYANHYHLDKPYSRNMLKIFIPMSQITLDEGPLEILNLKNTKNIFKKKESIHNSHKDYLVGDLGDIFLCKLNLCLHKAGIPKEGKTTNLIMIQLNPSHKWSYSPLIYERQFKMEPKFTNVINTLIFKDLIEINK
tara:strand:- start:67 stop:864 length:798 start_codon:yes stop_codon:yes gene_type:complete